MFLRSGSFTIAHCGKSESSDWDVTYFQFSIFRVTLGSITRSYLEKIWNMEFLQNRVSAGRDATERCVKCTECRRQIIWLFWLLTLKWALLSFLSISLASLRSGFSHRTASKIVVRSQENVRCKMEIVWLTREERSVTYALFICSFTKQASEVTVTATLWEGTVKFESGWLIPKSVALKLISKWICSIRTNRTNLCRFCTEMSPFHRMRWCWRQDRTVLQRFRSKSSRGSIHGTEAMLTATLQERSDNKEIADAAFLCFSEPRSKILVVRVWVQAALLWISYFSASSCICRRLFDDQRKEKRAETEKRIRAFADLLHQNTTNFKS